MLRILRIALLALAALGLIALTVTASAQDSTMMDCGAQVCLMSI